MPRVVALVCIAAGALPCVSAGTAAAAIPPNDTFASATAISSLPFSQILDTTQATSDQADAQLATACGYSGLSLSATVWYAYTPASDQVVTVDYSGSSYGPVLGVVTGAPGSFRPVVCNPGGGSFVARAGQAYHIDVAGIGGTGGTLHLSITGRPAPADLDQSFTTPDNLSGLINECCAYIGQTFTAGRTGLLTGVNIDVAAQHTSLPLHVAIRTVDSTGLPTTTVLGETLTTSSAPLTQLITFPRPVDVTAGTSYAIVVNYQGAPPAGAGHALGTWDGAGGNAYPAGTAVYSLDNGVSWSSSAAQGFDNHFQTYVQAEPTSKGQCDRGGWQSFSQFKNQGDCVSFVATEGRNPPG